MASKNDSIQKTLTVAFLLCLVCAMVVASAAVMLKPLQETNKALDRKKNILAAAGMLDETLSIEEQFEKVTPKVINLKTGEFTDEYTAENFDLKKVATNPETSKKLSPKEDIAKIQRRADYAVVYLVKQDGELDKVILPVHGYGLWSTLYGFIALENDTNTIAGLGFYEHGETPGLGGEVDNPRWKAQWPGKKVYREGEAAIQLIKGTVDSSRDGAKWQVDGLAGATLTGNGVTYMLRFWLGEMGYQTFLEKLRNGEV